MFQLNLERMVIPELKDVKSYNGEYYIPGEDGKWFKHLLDAYYGSSIHGAIIQNLHRRLQEGYEQDPLYYQISLDYLIFGGYSMQILWNLNHDKIVNMQHLDYSNVRCGLQDDFGKISLFYYSNDWFKYNNRKIEVMSPYAEEKISDDNQCFYYRRYNPGQEIYPKPYYFAGLKWIITDIELERYYASLVKNNFVANTILSVNSFMDEDKQKEFEKTLKKNFTGAENAGTLLVMYNETKENAPTIEKFNNDEDDTKYRYIADKMIENISVAHNVPTALIGILVPGKLGNSTDLPIYEDIYNKYVVQPLKDELTTSYEKLKQKLV
jgi:hypothetical protein